MCRGSYKAENVQTGAFGAEMDVEIEGDGPLTLSLDSAKNAGASNVQSAPKLEATSNAGASNAGASNAGTSNAGTSGSKVAESVAGGSRLGEAVCWCLPGSSASFGGNHFVKLHLPHFILSLTCSGISSEFRPCCSHLHLSPVCFVACSAARCPLLILHPLGHVDSGVHVCFSATVAKAAGEMMRITTHCTHTLYSHTVLIHCTHTLYSHTVLIHCTHTLYSYTVLIHCTHTLYSYTVLIHYTHTID
jgi:hypothetical protein